MATSTTMKMMASVRWGRTWSKRVPITAPPTAPIASHTATLQSTLPWAA